MNITIIWTPDIFSNSLFSSLPQFHSSFLSKQLENETIDFICVARDNITISTAYSIRENINSRNVYVLPYISSKDDSFGLKLEDSTWVLKYNHSDHSDHSDDKNNNNNNNNNKNNNNNNNKFTNPLGSTKFEEICLPYIKNLLVVKNGYNNSKKTTDFTVLIISDTDFLRQYFSCGIEPGQLYTQTFIYNEFYDIIPSHRRDMPIEQIGKWYTKYSNSINIESFKIFL